MTHEQCAMTLITQEGCPACMFLETDVLPFEDAGVEHQHIRTMEDSEAVNERFPNVVHVPTLVMDCNGKMDYFVGVKDIASMLLPQNGGSIDDYRDVEV